MDIVGYPLTMNSDRSKVMDFSTYDIFTEYVLMVPYPKEESRLDALIRPFDTTVRTFPSRINKHVSNINRHLS